MLSVSNLSVQFGKRVLFDEVNISFNHGNCYGIIGANGAGKSTFLKVLTGIMEPNSGNVHLESGKRMSVLEQDHFAYDDYPVLETVIRGNKPLFAIKKEMDDLYAKPDFSDADGERVGELQIEFEEMDGWNAESSAASLLSNLEISEHLPAGWQITNPRRPRGQTLAGFGNALGPKNADFFGTARLVECRFRRRSWK